MRDLSSKPWFKTLIGLSTLFANFVIIFGIYFAYKQLRQQTNLEKTRLAVEAVAQIREANFIKDYSELVAIYDRDRMRNELDRNPSEKNYNQRLILVMNKFNNIAILYQNDLANKCVIKMAVHPFVEEFRPVLDHLLKPFSPKDAAPFRIRFDSFSKDIEDGLCGG